MNQDSNLKAKICEQCNGSGKYYGEKCSNCIGTGYLAEDSEKNEYYVRIDNENLIVTGKKTSVSETQSQRNNQSQNSLQDPKGNVVKLVGNILFSIVIVSSFFIIVLYFRTNVSFYLLLVLLAIFWGLFNLTILPNDLLEKFKVNYISQEDPKDLHWAISEIKRIMNTQ
jgi:hypothetical protein